MNSVELVKTLCKERRIPISKIEKDLGYSNGYIGQLRKGTFPADRLKEIAEYLDVSIDYLMTGKEPDTIAEMAQMDVNLTNMKNRVKTYALKLNSLSEKDQEMIMQMIDRCKDN